VTGAETCGGGGSDENDERDGGGRTMKGVVELLDRILHSSGDTMSR